MERIGTNIFLIHFDGKEETCDILYQTSTFDEEIINKFINDVIKTLQNMDNGINIDNIKLPDNWSEKSLEEKCTIVSDYVGSSYENTFRTMPYSKYERSI